MTGSAPGATVRMYDSTTAADIERDAVAVMGYVDGAQSAWQPADWTLFPTAAHVTCTVTGKAGARVGDVETGDLTPASGALWAKAEAGAGRRPTLYRERSGLLTLADAVDAAGLARASVDLLVADWTGASHPVEGPDVPAGFRVVGVQYANPDTSGGHYDLSSVLSSWAGIAPPPPPPPPAPVHPPFPGRLLELAGPPYMSGADVREFQAQMLERGWSLGPTGADGIYGPVTAKAVREFQAQKGLRVDGIVGPITWAAAWTAAVTHP